MKGFKAYDIRGIYNQDFDRADVYRLGCFLPDLFNTDRILVGHDHRNTSDEIRENLVEGLLSRGIDVYDMGLATTPMVYFTAGKQGFDASVQITASHNPAPYNGFKISGKDVMPIGYIDGLNEMEKRVNGADVPDASRRGQYVPLEPRDDYIGFLKGYYGPGIEKLKLAVDCSDGMAGYVVHDLLGDRPIYMFDQPDGNFTHHDPNPLKSENQRYVTRKVLQEGCDAGILYDGDADRVVFFDEKGRFVSPDLIIALMGHYFMPSVGSRVLQDIRSSRAVKEYLSRFGAEVHTWKVGRAFACPRLKAIDGLYGGEFAGHYYFKDFYYADSAMMATLVVLNVLADFKEKGVPFSSVIDGISHYSSSGELNYTIEHKRQAIESVVGYFRDHEQPLETFDFDGVRMDFADWWFNIRPSNTEPYLRVIVEARTPAMLKEKVGIIGDVLSNHH